MFDPCSIEKADVKLCVLDVAELDNASSFAELNSMIRRVKPFLLINKLDSRPLTPSQALALAKEQHEVEGVWAASLQSGMGVDAFMAELGAKLHDTYAAQLEHGRTDAPLVINARHREHLQGALRFLDAFLGQGLKGHFTCSQYTQ